MANYVHLDGAVTPISDILNHSKSNKENNDGPALSYMSLGLIVQDVWCGSIQRAKRGPRNQQ